MRRLALALGLLLSVAVQAAPRTIKPNPVMDTAPGTTTGPLIDEDPQTVSHVYWIGSSWVDTKGNAWTTNGLIPQQTTSQGTLFPAGFSGTPRPGAGPFSDVNYYNLGTGSDPLDSTGDRYGCIVFNPTSIAGTQVFIDNGVNGTAGHEIDITAGGFRWTSNVPAAQALITANVALVNAVNVGCWWRTGNTLATKLNLGATVTLNAGALEVSGTAYAERMGRYDSGGFSVNGMILEYIEALGACPGGSCETWATNAQSRVFQNITANKQSITVTRTTSQVVDSSTNGSSSKILTVPPGVIAVGPLGYEMWGASVNYAIQSETSCVANAVGAGWTLIGAPTCLSDVSTAPDGNVEQDRWIANAINQGVFQASQGFPASTLVNASAWISIPTSGAATTATLSARCGAAPSSCACGTSGNGMTCATATGVTNANDCTATFSSLSFTPTRGWVTSTCPATVTSSIGIFTPGSYVSGTGAVDMYGFQITPTAFPYPYCPTTASTCQTNATNATVPITTPLHLTNVWCAGATVTGRFADANWTSGFPVFLAAGVNTAPNTFNFYVGPGANALTFNVYDSNGAAGLRAIAFAASMTNGSTHRVVGCNAPGTMSLWLDGVSVGGPTGAGTGVWSATPASYNVGNLNGTNQVNGQVKDVMICPGATSPAQCSANTTLTPTPSVYVVNLTPDANGYVFTQDWSGDPTKFFVSRASSTPRVFADDGLMGSTFVRRANVPSPDLLDRIVFDNSLRQFWKYGYRVNVSAGSLVFEGVGVLYPGENDYDGETMHTDTTQVGMYTENHGAPFVTGIPVGAVIDTEMEDQPGMNGISIANSATNFIRARFSINKGAFGAFVNRTTLTQHGNLKMPNTIYFHHAFSDNGGSQDISKIQAQGRRMYGAASWWGWNHGTFVNAVKIFAKDPGEAVYVNGMGGITGRPAEVPNGGEMDFNNISGNPNYYTALTQSWSWTSDPFMPQAGFAYNELRMMAHNSGNPGAGPFLSTANLKVQVVNANTGAIFDDSTVPGNSTGLLDSAIRILGPHMPAPFFNTAQMTTMAGNALTGDVDDFMREVSLINIPSGTPIQIKVTGNSTAGTVINNQPRLAGWWVGFRTDTTPKYQLFLQTPPDASGVTARSIATRNESAWTNGFVQAEIDVSPQLDPNDRNIPTLNMRYIDENNLIQAAWDSVNSQLTLTDVRTSVATTIGTFSLPAPPLQNFTLRIEANGTSRVLKYNGTTVISGTSPNADWAGVTALRVVHPFGIPVCGYRNLQTTNFTDTTFNLTDYTFTAFSGGSSTWVRRGVTP
jgi:Concanavalin A-like lectin/glucanases superfamily